MPQPDESQVYYDRYVATRNYKNFKPVISLTPVSKYNKNIYTDMGVTVEIKYNKDSPFYKDINYFAPHIIDFLNDQVDTDTYTLNITKRTEWFSSYTYDKFFRRIDVYDKVFDKIYDFLYFYETINKFYKFGYYETSSRILCNRTKLITLLYFASQPYTEINDLITEQKFKIFRGNRLNDMLGSTLDTSFWLQRNEIVFQALLGFDITSNISNDELKNNITSFYDLSFDEYAILREYY